MILCFDIGGSRIKAALALGSEVQSLGDIKTPVADFEAFLIALRGFAISRDLRGVSISIAGVVDPDTGKIRVANIPCADGRQLAQEVERALNLPTIVLNDADCFALAEATQGAGRGARNVFGIILGTGIGGGLVLDGQVVQGAGGYAGEWGHGPVLAAPYDFACGCGLRGCLDAVCGARGLEKLHVALGGLALPSTAILDSWHAGEPSATATVERWVTLIAPPLAMLLNTIGASVVPVGGGLSNDAGLIAKLDAVVRAMILRRTTAPILRQAECRPEPGLIGAAAAGQLHFA